LNKFKEKKYLARLLIRNTIEKEIFFVFKNKVQLYKTYKKNRLIRIVSSKKNITKKQPLFFKKRFVAT
jgi:hypothetical protein